MKTQTSVYDLEKLSTPGLLEARMGMACHACLYIQGTDFNVAIGMRPHDAAILAHCRNNFLDALRLAIAEHDWRRGYAGPCPVKANCPTCKLIAKLEKVTI